MKVGSHLRRTLVTGLLVLLPLVVTVWVLSLVLNLLDATVGPLQWLASLQPAFSVRHPILIRWAARGIGVLLMVVGIYLVGLLTTGMVGRRTLEWLEGWIRRVPVVGGIYGASRQLLDAVSQTGGSAFKRCVLLEYPRKGLFTVAFVTRDMSHHLHEDEQESVSVFVPTTPNPTSGFFLLVPRAELTVLDLAVEEGIKLIVSGGMVAPGDLGDRRRRSGAVPVRTEDREGGVHGC